MNRTILAVVLIVAGVAVAAVAGFANELGLSENEVAEGQFGWKQITGLAIGFVVAVIGVGLLVTGRESPAGEEPGTRQPD